LASLATANLSELVSGLDLFSRPVYEDAPGKARTEQLNRIDSEQSFGPQRSSE